MRRMQWLIDDHDGAGRRGGGKEKEREKEEREKEEREKEEREKEKEKKEEKEPCPPLSVACRLSNRYLWMFLPLYPLSFVLISAPLKIFCKELSGEEPDGIVVVYQNYATIWDEL